MLDMFKRPGDPDEHNQLFAIPGAALLAGSAAGHLLGKPHTLVLHHGDLFLSILPVCAGVYMSLLPELHIRDCEM